MSSRRPWIFFFLAVSIFSYSQIPPQQKIFPAPVSKMQAALKSLHGGTSGPLPVLDGFVVADGKKLDEYQRPYYQCSVRITPARDGRSLVRVTAKITAWDGDPAHPGYKVLQSNGRLESDLLDRLQDQLAANSESKATIPAGSSALQPDAGSGDVKASPTPDISAPMPQFRPSTGINMPSSPPDTHETGLEQQARSLEELVQGQSHPTNLIAVSEDQTPVLQDPSSDATVLFLASAQDEFEILDINPEWVHVRISGLSRGWLRRTSVEMLDGSDYRTDAKAAPIAPQPPPTSALLSSSLFSVSGEEDGSFPGEWAPLKGKSVKIISIQQAVGTGRITSPQDKMHFAETLFKSETTEKSAAGLVLIFDAEDGGMVAATQAILDQWKKGSLTEQALWKQCYLDPPEILGTLN